jgi:hypothetical protein
LISRLINNDLPTTEIILRLINLVQLSEGYRWNKRQYKYNSPITSIEKGNVHSTTGHEGPDGHTGKAVLFL